ncbi:MAG: sigma-70 family RNA polymerase sigma factor [Chloroflexi bacterium]|nr:MAG: sigma-70 family RNA polymerase sigma factor [Chloroflexota bacterium]
MGRSGRHGGRNRRLRRARPRASYHTRWVTDERELDPATEFRQLYDQQYLSVFRSIRGVVLETAAAEDLTQETFVRAYRARHRYTPTAPPGAWLRRIGINLAISYLRRQKLARVLPARLYIAPDRREYDRAEARDVVTKALTTLSPKLRAAVVLHYYDGLTREEIASVLGVPPGTVASRIAKAVAIMRKSIGSDQDLGPERSSSEGALRGR